MRTTNLVAILLALLVSIGSHRALAQLGLGGGDGLGAEVMGAGIGVGYFGAGVGLGVGGGWPVHQRPIVGCPPLVYSPFGYGSYYPRYWRATPTYPTYPVNFPFPAPPTPGPQANVPLAERLKIQGGLQKPRVETPKDERPSNRGGRFSTAPAAGSLGVDARDTQHTNKSSKQPTGTTVSPRQKQILRSAVWWHGTWSQPRWEPELMLQAQGYDNPFASPTDAYDYGQPLQVSSPPPVKEHFVTARAAYLRGETRKAMAEVNRALRNYPRDDRLHEFRALVLMTSGKYLEAAAALHALLAVRPGWDWTTMSRLFPGNVTYQQLGRTLARARDAQPEVACKHFLLAYHYITTGYFQLAEKELRQVVRLLPHDALARELLQQLASMSGN